MAMRSHKKSKHTHVLKHPQILHTFDQHNSRWLVDTCVDQTHLYYVSCIARCVCCASIIFMPNAGICVNSFIVYCLFHEKWKKRKEKSRFGNLVLPGERCMWNLNHNSRVFIHFYSNFIMGFIGPDHRHKIVRRWRRWLLPFFLQFVKYPFGEATAYCVNGTECFVIHWLISSFQLKSVSHTLARISFP